MWRLRPLAFRALAPTFRAERRAGRGCEQAFLGLALSVLFRERRALMRRLCFARRRSRRASIRKGLDMEHGSPTAPPGPGNDLWHLRQTVTAFVDLLGLSNALGELDRIVDEALEEAKARPLMQASLGRVLRFRRLFDEAFTEMSRRKEMPPTGLPAPALPLWQQSLESDVRIVHFSDCVLINVIIQRDNLLATVRGMIHTCTCLAYTCLRMMAEGQLLRGGIETGVAIAADDEQEVLGSGLVHAYGLESRIADHPRVCFGPRFMGMLSTMTPATSAQDPQSVVLRRSIEVIRSFIDIDQDGVPRLRILHALVQTAAVESGEADLIDRARRILTDRLSAMSPTRDALLMKKVSWAVNVLLSVPGLSAARGDWR